VKKITIRKAETLKTTAAFYAGGCNLGGEGIILIP
jgi:hypothetical protein